MEGGLQKIFRNKRFWVVVVYAALLLWSGIYRYRTPPPPIPKDRKTVEVNAVSGEKLLPRKIRLAYKEYTPKKEVKGQLPVVFVHGSPGDADAFDALAKMMPSRRMISIDLPGFGFSEHNVPDYSIKAHAVYVYQLLKKLHIEKAHLVGFSLGGGVITWVDALHPERVASLAYVSTIGVQEYELFGNYPVNHFIHGIQLALFWTLREFTPNFGLFDGMAMPYAWNFYDTDQRPLRKLMSRIKVPVLITHGTRDPLVPVEAAREHARIIPQSEYHEMDENHFYVFMRPYMVEPALTAFWSAVEAGKATTRATASPERLKMAGEPFVPEIVPATGATVLVLFIALGFLACVNEDVAFIVIGIFIAQGRIGPVFAAIVCLFAILIGMFLFRRFGKRAGSLTGRLVRKLFPNVKPPGPTGFLPLLLRGLRDKGFVCREYFVSGKEGTGFWKALGLHLASASMRAPVMIALAWALTEALKAFTPLVNTDTFQLTASLFLLYLAIVISMPFFSATIRKPAVRTKD